MSSLSRFSRVKQWAQFSRQWHVIDASHQDAYKLGEKVSSYLTGKWKPIYHPETDCGDHVVIVNCKEIAMHGFDWKHRIYHFDNQYPKGRNDIPAFELHEYDPCRIIYLATYKALGNNMTRRRAIERLHTFSDSELPQFVKANISSQLRQLQDVPKRADQYTEEERAQMPKLINYSQDHIVDWEKPVEIHGRYQKEVKGKKV
uniref:39S ribosomal protein L13, mitochondrial n=1 Tax=Rhabditophanes sp. KR3021 TaxID=114890 RepID=A0AC35TMD9_9BILA